MKSYFLNKPLLIITLSAVSVLGITGCSKHDTVTEGPTTITSPANQSNFENFANDVSQSFMQSVDAKRDGNHYLSNKKLQESTDITKRYLNEK